MDWPYAYTTLIWPALVLAVLAGALAYYGWRHRSTPGAISFTLLMLFSMLLALGKAFEEATSSTDIKIAWFEFTSAIFPLIVVLGLCFVIEYAGLDRWLTPVTLALLFLPSLVFAALILTNDSYHLIWRRIWVDQTIIEERGIANWFSMGYGYLLSLCHILVLIWLWISSPRHRWPAALLILAVLISRGAYLLEAFTLHPFSPVDISYLAYIMVTLLYAIVFIRFRIFSVVPIGRATVIERMAEGMLVLDAENHVADLNSVAEKLLNRPRAQILCKDIAQVLPSFFNLLTPAGELAATEVEIPAGEQVISRCYQVSLTSLTNRRGFQLGHVMVLHDITDLKIAQEHLLQVQSALATLHERERVARELHDSLGQVLGYVKMQTQAARYWLALDQKEAADSSLAQLVAVAQEAHTDVREYILGAKTAGSLQPGFLPTLQQYLHSFSELYSLRTELVAPPDWSENVLEPTVEAQLLRIIQETLTNTRKHGQAHCVAVVIQYASDQVLVTVQDDGVGFDPALLADGERQKYGLGFMRERAADVNGSVEIQSAPGQGTRVVVKVPIRQKDKSQKDAKVAK